MRSMKDKFIKEFNIILERERVVWIYVCFVIDYKFKRIFYFWYGFIDIGRGFDFRKCVFY